MEKISHILNKDNDDFSHENVSALDECPDVPIV
jgi:hypothetical protein